MEQEKTIKTTESDFNLFQSECLRWIKFWNLVDWDIKFRHEHLEDKYAQVVGDTGARAFWITLSTEFEEGCDVVETIKDNAFHEVCECILYKLREIAITREFDENVANGEFHAIIHRLQNVVKPLVDNTQIHDARDIIGHRVI